MTKTSAHFCNLWKKKKEWCCSFFTISKSSHRIQIQTRHLLPSAVCSFLLAQLAEGKESCLIVSTYTAPDLLLRSPVLLQTLHLSPPVMFSSPDYPGTISQVLRSLPLLLPSQVHLHLPPFTKSPSFRTAQGKCNYRFLFIALK